MIAFLNDISNIYLQGYNYFIEKRFKIAKDFRSCKPKKADNTMAKGTKTNNDIQNVTHKTKDRETRTPLKTGGELGCSGMSAV